MHLPEDLPSRGHTRVCLPLRHQEISLKHKALAQYKTQQRIMADFLSAFVRNSECFTLLKPSNSNSNSIESVVDHWRVRVKPSTTIPCLVAEFRRAVT